MTQDISVTLSYSVVYVAGTVNGVAYTFTLSGSNEAGSVWTAAVARAENDIYNMELTAVDDKGNTTTVSGVVYYGMHSLITDRTLADVVRWRSLRDTGYSNMTEAERAEWDAGNMKGAYNASDLNRVGAALNYLRDRLAEASYLPPSVFTAKTDWTAADIPRAADLTAYLGYVSTIREAMAQFATTPQTPADTGGLDYQEANNIEKILLDVDRLITNMLAARYLCGELYSGEV